MSLFKQKRLYIFLAIFGAVFFSYSYTKAQTYTQNITACGVLDQADTEYILQNDVSSDGTCFGVQANDIKLNLNGHTVTYSNGPSTIVANGDFESGSGTDANSWTQGADFRRSTGTFVDPNTLWSGSYAMAIDLPTSAQSLVTDSTVTIPANRTYAISAMIRNAGGSNAYIRIEDGSGNVLASQNTGSTYGRFSYVFVQYRPSVDTPVYIRLGVDGNLGGTGSVIFDDVRVQPMGDHGVVTAACYTSYLYDNPCGGSAANLQVTNGNIVQGMANSYLGHAINLNQGPNTHGVQIDNLNITIQGPNSAAVNTAYKSSLNIHHNTINNNVTTIVNRHNMDGATIRITGSSDNSQVYNNTIIGGPQGGILFPRGDNNSAYNNDINLNGRYSNDFGIYAWSNNMLVYGNNIHTTSGRGIHINGANNQIYNNTISVTELKQNQEYNGCPLGGVYGIQIEGGSTTNNKVYGNTVTAYADECDAQALRVSSISQGGNEIYNNTFSAVRIGNTSEEANASSFAGSTALIDIHDNTFVADGSIIDLYWNGATGTTFSNNTFRYGSNPVANPYVFYFEVAETTDFIIRDNIFAGGTSDSSYFSHPQGSPSWFAASSYTIEWTLDLIVEDGSGNPISGANVSIVDVNGQSQFSGTTNSSGNVSVVLEQFRNHNTTSAASVVDDRTPHTITVSASGYDSLAVETNMDNTKSLSINMATGNTSEGQAIPVSCSTSWDCTNWSLCSNNGTQTRTCVDTNACGSNIGKPVESQSCTPSIPEDNTPEDNTPEDNTPEDNTPEDNTPEDNTPDDTPSSNTGTGSTGGTTNDSTPNMPSNNTGSSLACNNCSYDRGSLIVLKNAAGAAVYHIGKDGKKYIFPDSKTYFTWNRDFVKVKQVDLATLDDYPDGGAVAYRGGTKLITHQNTARVYAVEPGGIIRWIPSEAIAKNLYGSDWQARVQDVIPGFFAISYTRGTDLSDKLPSGTLVKYGSDYYYVDGSSKRKFVNLDVLGANGFKIEDAILISNLSVYQHGNDIIDFDESVANYL